MKKYRQSIFLKAIELMKYTKYSCVALDKSDANVDELNLYRKLFKPKLTSRHDQWWFISDKESRIKALRKTARICSQLNTSKVKYKDLKNLRT